MAPNPLDAEPIDTQPLCDGRFVPFRLLGSGSQAETFEAVDRQCGKPVAIKRFDVRGASTWKDVELAEREARVLRSLRHPALPAYVHHFEQDGALYLVMEKVEGQDLARLLADGKRFSLEQILGLLETLADLFVYLHGQSPALVHRDIKPSNIVLRDEGGFSLIDFGSVRDGLRPQGGSTVVGTFGYMAPEQFQGRALPASDLYATGATVLTLLTGLTPDRLPHRGLDIDVRAALGSSVPSPWLDLLERLLCVDPDRRAANLSELLPALRDRATNKAGQSAFETAGDPAHGRGDDPTAAATPVGPERESEWMFAGGTSMPFIFIVVLSLLRLAVSIGLTVLVPLLLTALSVIFGSGLRQAARDVSRAGHAANAELSRLIERLSDAKPLVVRRQRHARMHPGWRSQYGHFASHPGSGSSKPRRMRVGQFDVELPPESDREPDRRRERR